MDEADAGLDGICAAAFALEACPGNSASWLHPGSNVEEDLHALLLAPALHAVGS
jgi:hypothetical protein